MTTRDERFAKIKSSTADIISSKSILRQREKEMKSLEWEPNESRYLRGHEEKTTNKERTMRGLTSGAKFIKGGLQKGRKGVKAGSFYTGATSLASGITKMKHKGKRSRFARYDPGIRLNPGWF